MCWLRAGPMPKQPVESRLASLGARGRPWWGAVGLSSAADPGPGFIKCASVPLWAVTLASCGRRQLIPLCLILFDLVPAET